jgi:L-lactate utilization protein LutC
MAEKSRDAEMNVGRDIILQSLSNPRRSQQPPEILLPPWTADLREHFIAKAKASAAQVHEIAQAAAAPAKISEVLRSAGARPELHIPAASPLYQWAWRGNELELSPEAPGGEDTALSAADLGIAETGTVVFLSGPQSLSSWHFRPGREFILLESRLIVPRLEDVLARIGRDHVPATINLVTGPSRTADIEQTIEMGAHGPREIHILLAA